MRLARRPSAPLLPVLSFLPSRSRILSSNPPGVETEGASASVAR
ncbi:hypothetical protein DC89_004918 [Escherichia coli]|nr:hypothetical protein [Escherichia coli]EFL9883327.1 hypothetical protein [Escherichia coli]EFL9955774.1 hypothetical protein [Escherichia coli]EFM0023302.1 hypothetical protein [Escherichia coli]EFM0066837.1 hypothetical protein [Escherichia coli]